MLPLLNSDGCILIQDWNGDYHYCPGFIRPPDSGRANNSSHYINWVIGVDPNARYVSDRKSSDAVEFQIACHHNYPEGGFTIAPGLNGTNGLTGYSLSSQQARDYIEKKYGRWGLERLNQCLKTGDPF